MRPVLKSMTLLAILCLILQYPLFDVYAGNAGAATVGQNASQLAQDFTAKAIGELKKANDYELDYPGIASRINEYSLKMAKDLLGGGVGIEAVSDIMQNSALWYGQVLKGMFEGKNYNELIQAYSQKLSDLLSRNHLDINIQSSIISSASDNLVYMNEVFGDLRQ